MTTISRSMERRKRALSSSAFASEALGLSGAILETILTAAISPVTECRATLTLPVYRIGIEVDVGVMLRTRTGAALANRPAKFPWPNEMPPMTSIPRPVSEMHCIRGKEEIKVVERGAQEVGFESS